MLLINNGKPEQVSGLANTGLLDYGARFYDPYGARWRAVDPMADKRHSYGCYFFCSDDPVNRVDQDGDVDWRLVGTGAFATVSGVGSVAGGAGMAATGAGAKGKVDILKDSPMTLSSKLSTFGTLSDSGLFYWI